MVDAFPRAELDAQEYREAETLAMQLLLQMPHHDLPRLLVTWDIMKNVIRRWHWDERMAIHRPYDALAEEVNARNVVRLVTD